MDDQPSLRKPIILILCACVVFFLISLLWHFYNTGTIIITSTDKYNSITLNRIVDGKSSGKTYKAYSKLSVTVHTGEYSVSVTGNSVATTQTIKLKPRQTLHYNINPINTTGTEPVAYKSAVSLAADNSQLIYLNGSNNLLYKIDNQNNLTNIGNSQTFQNAKWANASFGVGQDGSGKLYSINDGKISPLRLPAACNSARIAFDVSPNKTIYISCGSNIYARSQNNGFKKIYTSVSPNPTLSAANNVVAISSTQFGPNASNISKPVLTTLDISGKKNTKNIEAERLAWSPNGQYLATYNQSSPTIYDSTLHTIATVPTAAVVGQFAWLNNDTLLYSTDSQLWSYSLTTQKAQVFANMPLADSVTGLYINDEGSYVYITTLNSASDIDAIRRVGLKDQQVPQYIYNLQNILPEKQAGYIIGLINFVSPPTIRVQAYPNATVGNNIQQAQSQLQSQGFDISQVRFQQGLPVYSE